MSWDARMDELCDVGMPDDKKAALLASITEDDITADMLAACAQYLLSRALPLALDPEAVDICGTGGDSGKGLKTFNISTAAAFVLSAAGVPVVKHGNKAVSSQSGSSDVLAALGVPIATTAAEAETHFARHNLCFVSAPAFHPALKNVVAARKALGRASFFNLLGPLCNPARTKRQVIGAYSARFLQPLAEAAKILGKTDVIVAHSDDGLDEISISAPTRLAVLKNHAVTSEIHTPAQLADAATLCGGTPAENAAIIHDIFKGKKGAGADIICLNAAAGLVVAGKAADLATGFECARDALQQGLALKKLEEMRI